MPTALTQPRQFGWQATQLNFIGNLRSSRVTPARAEPLNIATNAMQRAAPMSSIQPRISAQRARAKLGSEMRVRPADSAVGTRMITLGPIRWGWRRRDGVHTAATAGAVQPAVRIENRISARA